MSGALSIIAGYENPKMGFDSIFPVELLLNSLEPDAYRNSALVSLIGHIALMI